MNGEAFTAFSIIGAVKILTSNAFGQILRVSVRWLARSETSRTRLQVRCEGDETGVQEFRKGSSLAASVHKQPLALWLWKFSVMAVRSRFLRHDSFRVSFCQKCRSRPC